MRRSPIRRSASLRRRIRMRRRKALTRAAMAPASPTQRAKVAGQRCIVCGAATRIDPTHLVPRSLGGCDEADCVVPLCRTHHRAYDQAGLDLVAFLEPDWRAELPTPCCTSGWPARSGAWADVTRAPPSAEHAPHHYPPGRHRPRRRRAPLPRHGRREAARAPACATRGAVPRAAHRQGGMDRRPLAPRADKPSHSGLNRQDDDSVAAPLAGRACRPRRACRRPICNHAPADGATLRDRAPA